MISGLYKNIWMLVTALACLLLSWSLQYVSFVSLTESLQVNRFQEVLLDKEQHLYEIFDRVESMIDGLEDEEYLNFEELHGKLESWMDDEGMDLLVYRQDSLICWTGNSLPVNQPVVSDKPVQFLGSSWDVVKERHSGDYQIVGIILIKHQYPYENQFLRNDFQADFHLPEGVTINEAADAGGHQIFDAWQQPLFRLDFSEVSKYNAFQSNLTLVLFYVGILMFLFYVRHLIKSIPDNYRRNIAMLLALLLLILADLMILLIPYPEQITHLELFSPSLFASSDLFPSLGDLLITSLFFFFMTFIFYSDFRLTAQVDERKRKLLVAVVFLLLMGYFQLILSMFRGLIMHSSISFETFRVLDISIFTFIGLFIMALHFGAFAMMLDKLFSLAVPVSSRKQMLLMAGIFGLVSFLAGLMLPGGADWIMALLGMIITGVIALIRASVRLEFRYSTFVLLIFLFGLLSVYEIGHYSAEKRHNEKKVLAVDLSTEHDPVAELLLKDLELELSTDQELAYMIHEGFTDHIAIEEYLEGNYFSGFWEKYEMHFTLCSPGDSLYIEPYDNVWYPCFEFFENLYGEQQIKIPGSDFYFIDNMSGRISYFASFEYYSADSSQQTTLFLELDSRLLPEELGYPELLLSERPRKKRLLRDYTYARYHENTLITQSGDYSYSLRPDIYSSGTEEFEYTSSEGFEHLAYHLDDKNIIVVSNEKVGTLNIAITFTYIFVFYYLLLTSVLLGVNIPFLKRSLQWNIKNKIQYTMIGILLLSLLLIGGGTILFSIRQYKERHFDNLSEKMQSVYIEVMHKLDYETRLDPSWQAVGYASLDELLKKFSNVFFTDIHLYDPSGRLLATSRSEIFENRLAGRIIHPDAYQELAVESAAEFVHEENIGRLRYLSAYVPFRNQDNQLLAYLNLPYFTRQQVLTAEISNLVVAVVNFYVLLITISILIAVFISTQITQPLRMIQDKFGEISFGKANEKIAYEAEDEIGSLVAAYNHMVDELALSAEKLARSERESAWREMAKQIAHEIKNPLTPMKLSVQHLQNQMGDDPDNGKQNLERITRTLIDQIDHLSAIATEFSNFAKMPRANHERVDLEEKIRKMSELFFSTQQTEIETRFEQDRPAIVMADPEQLSRVLINLLKNAIQSVPENREGRIAIRLETTEDHALISVMDNGRGIPAELGDRLFQPNFTTKSSGMGMGLAIVKSIIENAGGSIRYETAMGEGTTFIISLPLAE